jgi:hypothetical protein
MNHPFIKFLFGGFLFFIISSCNIINKEETIPSYIHIEKFTLTTDYTTQGSNAHKITDAWVYVDGILAGVFELPVTLPILESGNHEITLKAGIKNNGIPSTRTVYPFYESYTTFTTLVPESILTIDPVISYNTLADIVWKEDFEGAAFSIVDSSNTDTVMKITTSTVFEGNKSGIVTLDGTKTLYLGKSSNTYVLPNGGAGVYLELNYKSNNAFVVGGYAANSTSAQPLLYVNPSDEWNKIYIELTPMASNPSNSNPFRIYIAMAKDGSVDYPELLIDNVKLVY